MSLLSKSLSALSAFFAVKKSAMDPAVWLRGDEMDAGEGAKLLSPYSQSAWVYIAVSVLAENVAQIPFRISRIPQSAKRDLSRSPRSSPRPSDGSGVRGECETPLLPLLSPVKKILGETII